MNIALIVYVLAEGESATFNLLSLANANIAKCVDQIYPPFVPPNVRLMREPDCEELVGVTWRESDCEELVGVTHRGWC